ncbi:hypothetical protein Tco_0146340 [Tanacetum coccineum]
MVKPITHAPLLLEADTLLTRLTFTKPCWRSSSLPLAIIRGKRLKAQIGGLGIKGWDGSLGTLLWLLDPSSSGYKRRPPHTALII